MTESKPIEVFRMQPRHHHPMTHTTLRTALLLAVAALAACSEPVQQSAPAPAPQVAEPAAPEHPDFSGVWMAIGVERAW